MHGDRVRRPQFRRKRFEHFDTPRHQDQVMAVGGEQLRQLQADAGRRARDEGELPLRRHVDGDSPLRPRGASAYSAAFAISAADPRRM
jgi:hypothetical protein